MIIEEAVDLIFCASCGKICGVNHDGRWVGWKLDQQEEIPDVGSPNTLGLSGQTLGFMLRQLERPIQCVHKQV